MCDVRFTAARVRLANLIRAGSLTEASTAAWGGGLAALPGFRIRRGDPPALARVCLLEPAAGTGIVTLPLRWETAAPGGGLMRVLNAGLTLMPSGPAQTVLRLDGVARLPYPAAGHQRAGGMRAHRAVAACARFLLTDIADALARPAPARRPKREGGSGHSAHRQVAVPRQRRPPDHGQQSPPRGRAGMP